MPLRSSRLEAPSTGISDDITLRPLLSPPELGDRDQRNNRRSASPSRLLLAPLETRLPQA
jgi:hypothetical protein